MYIEEKGKIISKDKIPYPPRWFSDNRISFQVNEQGLGDIDYWNPTSKGHYKAFVNSFWGGMRFYVKDTEHNYLLSFDDCEILPFGINGNCKTKDNAYHLSFCSARDCVFIVLKTGETVPKDSKFRAEFYKTYCMVPQGPGGDLRYKSGIKREWNEFALKDNIIEGGFKEETSTTGICIGGNFDISFVQTPGNTKYIISTPSLKPNTEYVLVISFATSESSAIEKCKSSVKNHKDLYQMQINRYEKVAQKAPVLISPYEHLNKFMAFAPLYHEALKVTDVPGAIKAQTTRYWVWGWDTLTSNDCTAYWGDMEHIGSMLDCFEKYADEKEGVAHAFGNDMSFSSEAAPTAQGMYITILYLYFSHGGNIEKYYPFAKKLLEMILKTECKDLGLCEGTSLCPDFRNLINETGKDISAFNNTVGYCAVRSLEVLANHMGDTQTALKAKEFAERTRKNFINKMYNKDLNFIDSSVDSVTYKYRNCIGNNAVKWENNFCSELVDSVTRESVEFYEKHLVSPAGLRPYAVWSDAYDRDANQLSCWWPVMSEFFIRIINEFNKPELIEKYIGWISYWTEKLTIPEGISCYNDDENVPFDNWNCFNGIWQGYTMRGFYNAIIHSIVGVDLDEGGLTVYPYNGKELTLLGLHFGDNMTFDIEMKGSGQFVKAIEINGKTIYGTNKIPFDLLQKNNNVVVYRENENFAFCHIKNAFGIKINHYSFTNDKITAELSGLAYREINVYSKTPLDISLDEKIIDVKQNDEGVYKITVKFSDVCRKVNLSLRR
jgi:hypothetical protein